MSVRSMARVLTQPGDVYTLLIFVVSGLVSVMPQKTRRAVRATSCGESKPTWTK